MSKLCHQFFSIKFCLNIIRLPADPIPGRFSHCTALDLFLYALELIVAGVDRES